MRCGPFELRNLKVCAFEPWQVDVELPPSTPRNALLFAKKNHNHVKINMTFNHTVKYSIVRGFPRLFCSWMKSLTGYLHTIFTAWLGVLQLEIDGWRRDRHCHFFWPAKQPSQEVSKQISHLICRWNRSQLAWSEVIKDFCNWKMSLLRSDRTL